MLTLFYEKLKKRKNFDFGHTEAIISFTASVKISTIFILQKNAGSSKYPIDIILHNKKSRSYINHKRLFMFIYCINTLE